MDIKNEKEPDVNKYIYIYKCLLFVAYPRYFFTSIHRVTNFLQKYFNLSWLRVRMTYHSLDNLSELLNLALAAKIVVRNPFQRLNG